MSIQLLVSLITVGFAGMIAHEIAHWLIWTITGRQPRLDLWGLTVRPRAGPQHTTTSDRLAAAAPYAVGLSVAVLGFASGSVLWIAFGIAMIQIPSRADIITMRGKAIWDI